MHLIIQSLVSVACILIGLRPLDPFCLLIKLTGTDTKWFNYSLVVLTEGKAQHHLRNKIKVL